MRIYRSEEAPRKEPPGHFGHLEVSDVLSTDAGELFSVQLSYAPPRAGGEMHSHPDQGQLFLVLQGELSFGTGNDRFTLHERDAVFFGPGEQHETLNSSDAPSISVVVTATATASAREEQ
jgi:quercetin dioxygenase-like cupin family protein